MISGEREVLHLPETAHLYALLNCAQIRQNIHLESELEAYLIQTMLRFSEMPLEDEWLFHDADFNRIMTRPDESSLEFLKDIADYCLISSGLMADYFADEEQAFAEFRKLGLDAFSMLSEHQPNKDNIYLKLHQNFSVLVEVLKCSLLMLNDKSMFDDNDWKMALSSHEQGLDLMCVPQGVNEVTIH